MSGPEATAPIFTIVVPAYERAATIARTVTSILAAADALAADRSITAQAAAEIVVVDDGSADDTAAVTIACAPDDARLHVITQPNAGPSAARNTGIRAGRGDYLLCVDADDVVARDALVWFAAQLDEGATLAFSGARAVRPDGEVGHRGPEPMGPAFGSITATFLPGLFASRRDDVLAIGGFATLLRYSENTELGLRLVAHLDARRALVTRHTDQELLTVHLPDRPGGSNAYTDEVRFTSALYLADTHAARLALDPAAHATYWAIAGVAAARLDRPRDAQRCFARAVRAEPTNAVHLARLAVAGIAPLRRRRWPGRTAAPGSLPPMGTLYDEDFYDEISPFSRDAAQVVVPFVRDLVQPTSVVDVGCGIGAWLAVWREHGVDDLLGIDGDYVRREDLQIPVEEFREADLEHPEPLERRFDLAVSLEVAEHLDPAAATGFVSFLTSLAPVVLFSGAVPGQGGVGHVNEQWPAFWAAEFAAQGYQVADIVRPIVWNEPTVAHFYSQNLLLFACDDRFATVTPAFPLVPADGVAAPLPLVHPRFVDALQALHDRPRPPASFQSLLRQLPGAGVRATKRRLARR